MNQRTWTVKFWTELVNYLFRSIPLRNETDWTFWPLPVANSQPVTRLLRFHMQGTCKACLIYNSRRIFSEFYQVDTCLGFSWWQSFSLTQDCPRTHREKKRTALFLWTGKMYTKFRKELLKKSLKNLKNDFLFLFQSFNLACSVARARKNFSSSRTSF